MYLQSTRPLLNRLEPLRSWMNASYQESQLRLWSSVWQESSSYPFKGMENGFFCSCRTISWLTLHLGLTGRLVYLQAQVAEADVVEVVPSHTRLLISFQNECRLAFDDPRIFGEVGLTKSPSICWQSERSALTHCS